LTLGISAAAALFVFSYNLEKSVPAEGIDLFRGRIVPGVNLIAFSLGGILVFWFARNVARVLNGNSKQNSIPAGAIRQAIDENLRLGHRAAIMSISLWAVGGMMYPLLLTFAGYSLSGQEWLEFAGSHFQAGLIAGAYLFWMITYCSLHAWQPRLLSTALEHDEYSNWTTSYEWLQRLCSVWHVLALAIPPVAIVWLVLYNNSRDKFALAVVSIVSVLGLVVLSWVSRRVHDQLATLKSLVHREDDGSN
jgi:hypothetical protein